MIPEKKKILLIIILTLSLLLGFYLVTLFASETLLQLLETYVSPDGNMSCPECIYDTIYLIIALFGLVGIVLLAQQSKTDITNRPEFSKQLHTLFRFSYFILSFLIIAWVLLSQYSPKLYREDNFFESLSAIFFFIASIVLFFNRRNNFWLLILSIVFLFFGLEEIGYGQRIFAWETPEFFMEYNDHNETNIHNLIFGRGIPLERLFTFFTGILLLFSEFFRSWVLKYEKNLKLSEILPDRNFQVFGLVFIVLTAIEFPKIGELLEEVTALLAITYSIFMAHSRTPR